MAVRALPAPLTWRWRWIGRAIGVALLVFWWIWLIQSAGALPAVTDARAYWSVELGPDLYGRLAERQAFLYSPIAAQIIAPFTALPFIAFYAILSAVSLACLAWLVGPLGAVGALLIFPPVAHEIGNGNIHLILAASIVAALRQPGWWSVALLTKVTPGIGIMWHVFRREWSAAAWAAGVTAILVAASALVAPDLWLAWIGVLAESDRALVNQYVILGGWPLALRLAIGVALVYVAARMDRPALVVVGCLIALPAVWTNALAMLVAIPRLTRIR